MTSIFSVELSSSDLSTIQSYAKQYLSGTPTEVEIDTFSELIYPYYESSGFTVTDIEDQVRDSISALQTFLGDNSLTNSDFQDIMNYFGSSVSEWKNVTTTSTSTAATTATTSSSTQYLQLTLSTKYTGNMIVGALIATLGLGKTYDLTSEQIVDLYAECSYAFYQKVTNYLKSDTTKYITPADFNNSYYDFTESDYEDIYGDIIEFIEDNEDYSSDFVSAVDSLWSSYLPAVNSGLYELNLKASVQQGTLNLWFLALLTEMQSKNIIPNNTTVSSEFIDLLEDYVPTVFSTMTGLEFEEFCQQVITKLEDTYDASSDDISYVESSMSSMFSEFLLESEYDDVFYQLAEAIVGLILGASAAEAISFITAVDIANVIQWVMVTFFGFIAE